MLFLMLKKWLTQVAQLIFDHRLNTFIRIVLYVYSFKNNYTQYNVYILHKIKWYNSYNYNNNNNNNNNRIDEIRKISKIYMQYQYCIVHMSSTDHLYASVSRAFFATMLS